MKRIEENKEIKKIVLNELYDIKNLKNDLDEIFNIEDITVSESLIQATLIRAKEEQSKQQLQNKQTIEDKQQLQNKQTIEDKQQLQNKQMIEDIQLNHTKQSAKSKRLIASKRGVPFHYGMVAACACILLVVGLSLITNQSVNRKDSTSSTQEKSTADSSMGLEDMETTETTETSKDDTGEGSVFGEAEYNSNNSMANTEEGMVVPSFFDIPKEEDTSYTVSIGEISKIIIYDENDIVLHTITDTSEIESIYNSFSKVGSKNHTEEVQNEKQEGQYIRRYDIIAQENYEWSELHIWISNVDEKTSIVMRQLITEDGEVITHRITDVNAEIALNIIKSEP